MPDPAGELGYGGAAGSWFNNHKGNAGGGGGWLGDGKSSCDSRGGTGGYRLNTDGDGTKDEKTPSHGGYGGGGNGNGTFGSNGYNDVGGGGGGYTGGEGAGPTSTISIWNNGGGGGGSYLSPFASRHDPSMKRTLNPWKFGPLCDGSVVINFIPVIPVPPVTTVPEPATLALLGVELIGIAIMRRRA